MLFHVWTDHVRDAAMSVNVIRTILRVVLDHKDQSTVLVGARTSVDRDLANLTCQGLGQLVSYAFAMLPDQITGEDWSAF
jgi:hypothetical protein